MLPKRGMLLLTGSYPCAMLKERIRRLLTHHGTEPEEKREEASIMRKHRVVAAAFLSSAFIAAMVGFSAYADEKAPMQLITSFTYQMEWSDDAGRYIAESICPQIALDEASAEEYPELARAFDRLNGRKKTEFADNYQTILEEAKSRYQEDPDYGGSFTDTGSYYVQRADGHVVSVLEVHSGFGGGAHGYKSYTGMNYDPASGNEWKLSDFVTDGERFRELVKEKVYSDYPEVEKDLTEEYFNETALDDMIWLAGCEGITCCFNEYTLGAYAIGDQTVMIPYAGNEKLFTGMASDVPADCGTEFPLNHAAVLGGRKVVVSGSLDEYGSYGAVTISVDGEETVFDDDIYTYSIKPTFLRAHEEEYLYLEYSSDNDYRMFDIYRLGEKPERIGTSDLATACRYMEEESSTGYLVMTDPENLILSARTQMLSTADGQRLYRVGADGMPEAKEPYFHIVGERVLTTKQELTCEEADEEGNRIGTITIPAGTEMTLLRTDNVSVVDLSMKDGRIARVEVSGDQYPNTIDGKKASDIFDGMMFAG